MNLPPKRLITTAVHSWVESEAELGWDPPFEAGGRCPLPQGKAIGDSSPANWNSKISIAGQLREEVRPCPDRRDHVFLILGQDTSLNTHTQKGLPGGQKESDPKWCSAHRLFGGIHLGQETHVHTREDTEIHQIRTLNQANQNDWPKETQKKCPIQMI